MNRLSDIEINNTVIVEKNNAIGPLKERLLALGITKGAEIKVLRKGPKNNLTVYLIRGAMIALRKEEGNLIKVRLIEKDNH